MSISVSITSLGYRDPTQRGDPARAVSFVILYSAGSASPALPLKMRIMGVLTLRLKHSHPVKTGGAIREGTGHDGSEVR